MTDASGTSPALEKPKRAKSKRQTQACDACRARKVKCDRTQSDESRAGMSSPTKCGPCGTLGIPCTFSYAQKKRGPQVKYLQRIVHDTEADAPASSTDEAVDDQPVSAIVTTRTRVSPYPPNPVRQETSSPYVTTTSYYRSTDAPGIVDRGTLAEQHAMHAHALEKQGFPLGTFRAIDVERDWEPHLLMTLEATKPGGKAYLPDLPSSSAVEGSRSTLPATLAEAGPSGSHEPAHIVIVDPQVSTKSLLDATMPRWKLLRIMELFFDHICPTTPSVDQTALMSDLQGDRDAREGQVDWSCMVLAIAAHTLAQLPACFVPLSKEEGGTLMNKCRRTASSNLFESSRPSMEHVIALGHLAWTDRITQNVSKARTQLAAAWATALDLGLHDRKAIQSSDTSEAALRRRVFWLLSSLDKTLVIGQNVYPIIPRGICVDPYQEAIDDAYDKAVNHGEGEELPDEPKGAIAQRLIDRLLSVIGSVKGWSHRDGMRWDSPTAEETQIGLGEINDAFRVVDIAIDDWSWFGLGDPSASKGGPLGDLDGQMKDVERSFTDQTTAHDVLRSADEIRRIQFILTLGAARCILNSHAGKTLKSLSRREMVAIQTQSPDAIAKFKISHGFELALANAARGDTLSWPDAVSRSVAGTLRVTPLPVFCLYHPTLVPLLELINTTILQYPLVDSASTFVPSSEAREYILKFASKVTEAAIWWSPGRPPIAST